MHRRITALIVLFLLSCTFIYAGSKKPAVLRKDSSAIGIKKLDAAAIKKYTADKEFNYADGASAAPSLWDRFWLWFWGLIGLAVASSSFLGVLLMYVLPALLVGVLVYIILKSTKLLNRNAKKTTLEYYESLENIHEIDFDSEIERAVAQYNYRLAVRLLYLKCLKQLSDAGLIHWQIDKTNSAYYYELNNADQRNAFGSLTRRFEFVWYGGFSIDERAFKDIDQLFHQFKKQLP
jgi:hypothetical protein